jgi:hypothetical protein
MIQEWQHWVPILKRIRFSYAEGIRYVQYSDNEILNIIHFLESLYVADGLCYTLNATLEPLRFATKAKKDTVQEIKAIIREIVAETRRTRQIPARLYTDGTAFLILTPRQLKQIYMEGRAVTQKPTRVLIRQSLEMRLRVIDSLINSITNGT